MGEDAEEFLLLDDEEEIPVSKKPEKKPFTIKSMFSSIKLPKLPKSKPKPPARTLRPRKARKAKKAPTKFGKKTSKTDKKPKVDKKKSSTMKLTPRKPADKKAAIIYILSSQDFSPGCGCRQRNMIL